MKEEGEKDPNKWSTVLFSELPDRSPAKILTLGENVILDTEEALFFKACLGSDLCRSLSLIHI